MHLAAARLCAITRTVVRVVEEDVDRHDRPTGSMGQAQFAESRYRLTCRVVIPLHRAI